MEEETYAARTEATTSPPDSGPAHSGQPEHPQPGLGAGEVPSSAARWMLRLSHTSTTTPPGSCRWAAISRSRYSVQVNAFVSPLRRR